MSIEEIKQIVAKMTLEEKASLASGKDFWQSQEIARLGIPSIYFADGPHGLRKQEAAADHLGMNESVKSTCFPTAVTMASAWDEGLCQEVGRALGKEASALNVGVLLGPGANIKRSPLCGRNFEYFSEDPYLAGKCASSLIRGVQEYAASACVKHFACNNQETGRMYVDSVVDERALREIYLTPFEMAVKEGGVRTVMSAYNQINGVYANENPHVMREILREEWGFDGVVVTDWGGCNERVAGYACGNEIEMPTTCGEGNAEIVAAVKEGRLDERTLDENVTRFLSLVFHAQETLARSEKRFDADAHHALAKKASSGAMVLLKNDGALPLSREERVCFIGDFVEHARYQGGGSSCVNPTRLETVLKNIDAGDPICFTGYEQGFHRYGRRSKSLVKRAVKLLEKSDKAVVFLGLDDVTESEGKDRENMRLPANQIELLNALKATKKPIVAVLSCGSPVETEWDEGVNALLCVYLTGQAGAQSIIDNLTGTLNPSGKLAETFPVRLEDNPSYAHYLRNEMTAEYRESIFVGYRYYERAGVAPKYPFGHGLSYTQFAYSNLTVSAEGVRFTLKNTGKVGGAEVAQLYIGAKNSKIYRPVKELKGFEKVYLEAGESKELFIPFDEYSFRWYNPKRKRWEVEDCVYTVSVCASSADIRLTAEFTPEGGVSAENAYGEELAPYTGGEVSKITKEQFEALLGREVPYGGLNFIKKNRIEVGYNTSIYQLRYARGWTGRAFAGAIVLAEKFLRAIGKRKQANVMKIGPYYMPVRGLARLTGGLMTTAQLDGLIDAFNGHFFRGISTFFRAGRKKKKK